MRAREIATVSSRIEQLAKHATSTLANICRLKEELAVAEEAWKYLNDDIESAGRELNDLLGKRQQDLSLYQFGPGQVYEFKESA